MTLRRLEFFPIGAFSQVQRDDPAQARVRVTPRSPVWIKTLGAGDPLRLTFHDTPASRPRWSAEGNQIVYSVQGMSYVSLVDRGSGAHLTQF